MPGSFECMGIGSKERNSGSLTDKDEVCHVIQLLAIREVSRAPELGRPAVTRNPVLVASFLASSLFLSSLVSAQWQVDGIAVCPPTAGQMSAVAISDGAGGAIIAWAYTSGDGGDIYAQRIDGSGNVLWTAAGVPLCTAGDWQSDPTILSDNAGGAIVAVSDLRDGVSDIYAQRIDGAGAVQWTADGV